MKMKACMVAYTFYEIDFRVRRYADALVSAGYDVDVFALRRKGQSKKEKLNGATIYHLQERDYNEKGLASYVIRMVAFFGRVSLAIVLKQFQYRYRLVHFHNPPDFLVFSALVPKILGAKVIYDMHENLPEFFSAKFNKNSDGLPVRVLLLLEKIAMRFADFNIVAHDLLRERVLKRDGIPEQKCVALLNYPSKSFFEPSSQNRKPDTFSVVYPGTISHQHGIDIAVKAMAIVRQECNAKLDIYGKLNNPLYHQELTKLIDDLKLDGTVSFHGVVPFDEMRSILANASIGVVPKRGGIFGSEAFSTKILEFMAAGLPVVVSKTKIDEYYFDSSIVMFFEPENHADLARCILDLYRDQEKREVLTGMGRQFIEKNNWEIKSRMYLDIVAGLVGTTKNQKYVR